MLTHSSEHQAKEPTVATSGACLQEREIKLLALDGALGTRASVLMRLPKVAISRDEGVKAIVFLRVGVDDASVGRIGTAVGKEWARGEGRGFLGSGQGAAPLDAQAIIAEASVFHWKTSNTDGNVIFKSQRAGISQIVLVALIEGDDEGHAPTSRGETEVSNGIVGGIQGGSPDRESKSLTSVVESGKSVDRIVAVAVGNGDDQGKLTAMIERVGGEFVEAVSIDPALTVAVPAPESERIAIGTQAGATLLRFLASIIAGTELLAVGISPGREFAAVTSDVEIGKVNQA
jgi:hypothetical protein